jgi:hypothetical protein
MEPAGAPARIPGRWRERTVWAYAVGSELDVKVQLLNPTNVTIGSPGIGYGQFRW